MYYVLRVVLLFYCPPHIVCTHKFSNPLFGITLDVVVIISYLYVHPHVPSILFSLPCAARRARLPVLVRNGRKRKNSRYSRTCVWVRLWGAPLATPLHVENIINFVPFRLIPGARRPPPPALKYLRTFRFSENENFVILLFRAVCVCLDVCVWEVEVFRKTK